jgi:hypothetical protein
VPLKAPEQTNGKGYRCLCAQGCPSKTKPDQLAVTSFKLLSALERPATHCGQCADVIENRALFFNSRTGAAGSCSVAGCTVRQTKHALVDGLKTLFCTEHAHQFLLKLQGTFLGFIRFEGRVYGVATIVPNNIPHTGIMFATAATWPAFGIKQAVAGPGSTQARIVMMLHPNVFFHLFLVFAHLKRVLQLERWLRVRYRGNDINARRRSSTSIVNTAIRNFKVAHFSKLEQVQRCITVRQLDLTDAKVAQLTAIKTAMPVLVADKHAFVRSLFEEGASCGVIKHAMAKFFDISTEIALKRYKKMQRDHLKALLNTSASTVGSVGAEEGKGSCCGG